SPGRREAPETLGKRVARRATSWTPSSKTSARRRTSRRQAAGLRRASLTGSSKRTAAGRKLMQGDHGSSAGVAGASSPDRSPRTAGRQSRDVLRLALRQGGRFRNGGEAPRRLV